MQTVHMHLGLHGKLCFCDKHPYVEKVFLPVFDAWRRLQLFLDTDQVPAILDSDSFFVVFITNCSLAFGMILKMQSLVHILANLDPDSFVENAVCFCT